MAWEHVCMRQTIALRLHTCPIRNVQEPSPASQPPNHSESENLCQSADLSRGRAGVTPRRTILYRINCAGSPPPRALILPKRMHIHSLINLRAKAGLSTLSAIAPLSILGCWTAKCNDTRRMRFMESTLIADFAFLVVKYCLATSLSMNITNSVRCENGHHQRCMV